MAVEENLLFRGIHLNITKKCQYYIIGEREGTVYSRNFWWIFQWLVSIFTVTWVSTVQYIY